MKEKGFPFLEILTLIFVVLKLTGYIAWSWWLVFLPVLIPLVILILILIVAGISTLIVNAFGEEDED